MIGFGVVVVLENGAAVVFLCPGSIAKDPVNFKSSFKAKYFVDAYLVFELKENWYPMGAKLQPIQIRERSQQA